MTNFIFSKIIAHRGASAYAPENSLRALELAWELGAQWVEFDVQLTKDQQLVVVHDENLKRLTGKDCNVAELTFSEIRKIPLINSFSPQECLYIPSLIEWIQLALKLSLKMNLEIKCTAEEAEKIVSRIVDHVHQCQLNSTQIIFSSFELSALQQCRQMLPHFWLGLNTDTLPRQWEKQLNSFKANSVHLKSSYLREKTIQQLHQQGYKVLAYTVNRKKRAEKLLDKGVDAIFSDYPDLLID